MKLNVTLIVFNFIAYNNFYNFLIQQRVSYLKMRKNTILSNSNEKSDQKNFWKKKKKPICLKINEKEADDNLVYRALKNQRDAKTILNFILGDMGSNKSSAKNKRPKSELNHPFHLPTSEQKYQKSKSVIQRQTFRQKAVNIMIKTKRVTEQLQPSKRRIRILDKFNKRVDKYCSNIPDYTEQIDNQSAMGNEDFVNLFNQDLFPTEDLYRRASSFIHYNQPKIPIAKLKRLKEKYKLNTAPSTSNTEPFVRLLTLNI